MRSPANSWKKDEYAMGLQISRSLELAEAVAAVEVGDAALCQFLSISYCASFFVVEARVAEQDCRMTPNLNGKILEVEEFADTGVVQSGSEGTNRNLSIL